MLHHLLSLFARNLSVGVGPARLVESSCLLRAATQHPGSSSPVSLLRRSSTGVIWMWIASLNSSSLECLAMSTTVVSSYLMAWWSLHALLLQTSPGFLSSRPLGVLSAWSPVFSWFHQCSSYHICRGFGTPPWPSSPLVEGPSPWSALSGVTTVQP